MKRKKLISLILCLLMVLALVACGDSDEDEFEGQRVLESGSKESAKPKDEVTETEEDTETEETEENTETKDAPETKDPTVAPTATPTPTPEPEPQKPSYQMVPCEESHLAILAYARYLDAKIEGGEISAEDLHANLIFLNDDLCPELCWGTDDSHANGFHLCIFDGQKVIDYDELGSSGRFSYLEKNGVVLNSYGGMGVYSIMVQMIDKTELKTVSTIVRQDTMVEDSFVTSFSIDDKECTEEEYNKALAFWEVEQAKDTSYRDAGFINFMDYGYYMGSTYQRLCEKWLIMGGNLELVHGVPRDIFPKLVGSWKMVAYEVEGYQATPGPDEINVWNISEDGVANLEKNAFSEYDLSMTFVPYSSMYDTACPWSVMLLSKAQPGGEYYFALESDGRLRVHFILVTDDMQYANVCWYEKQ